MSLLPAQDSLALLLDASLSRAGLAIRGPVPPAALRAALEGLPPPIRARYGADRALGAFAVALPYAEGPLEPPAWARDWLAARPGPLASIARFARAHWYREAAARLRRSIGLARAGAAELGLGPGLLDGSRCLANSALPEKRLALAAGLGSLGRQGLLLVPGAGSACVLGVLLLPLAIPGGEAAGRTAAGGAAASRPPELGADCGSCRACIEACPSGALSEAGYERELCLQFWSTRPGPLPPRIEGAWGSRLYGCEACQEACPRFRPDPAARTELGLLGPGLPASWLAEAPEAEIRARLRGSALGLGWMPIEAFRRSARIALRGASGGISPGFDARLPSA